MKLLLTLAVLTVLVSPYVLGNPLDTAKDLLKDVVGLLENGNQNAKGTASANSADLAKPETQTKLKQMKDKLEEIIRNCNKDQEKCEKGCQEVKNDLATINK